MSLIDEAVMLIDRCPIGHAHGHIIVGREYTIEALIEWIDKLHELKTRLRTASMMIADG